jgi:hypothetical protein
MGRYYLLAIQSDLQVMKNTLREENGATAGSDFGEA